MESLPYLPCSRLNSLAAWIECHLPADLAPGVGDLLADHRLEHAVLVGRIAPGEAALDAGMAFVGLAVLPRHHADDLVALHLGLESATNAAVGAGGDHAVLGLAEPDHGFLLQRGGRAGFHAGAAAHALGFHEGLVLARRDARLEAPAADRQREGALGFLAGTHAAVAHDALRRVVAEVRVRFVLLAVQVVGTVEAVAHVAQAGDAGHVLELAVAVGRAGKAVERVIGDVELHHALAQLLQPGCLRAYLHAGFGWRGARGREALAAVDLDQAQAARAEGLQAVGGAELGHLDAGVDRGAHQRSAGRHGDLLAVDLQRDFA